MKIAVVGSRLFPDRSQVEKYIEELPEGTVIISGGARGTDTWAEDYARRRGLQVMIFKPAYQEHGLRAPFVRNALIAEQCDKMAAFWDGKSKGTMDTIKRVKALKKPVEVFLPRGSTELVG